MNSGWRTENLKPIVDGAADTDPRRRSAGWVVTRIWEHESRTDAAVRELSGLSGVEPLLSAPNLFEERKTASRSNQPLRTFQRPW